MGWRAIGEEVELHSGVPEGEGAHVGRVVVEELSGALLDADRREIVRLVPDWIRDALEAGSYRGEVGPDGLYGRVADRLELEVPRAVELTKLVCSSVTHRLEDDLVRVLKTHLPDEIAALLVDRPHDLSTPVRANPPPPTEPGAGHTLSSGKRGSHAPLSEERPGSAHPVSEED